MRPLFLLTLQLIQFPFLIQCPLALINWWIMPTGLKLSMFVHNNFFVPRRQQPCHAMPHDKFIDAWHIGHARQSNPPIKLLLVSHLMLTTFVYCYIYHVPCALCIQSVCGVNDVFYCHVCLHLHCCAMDRPAKQHRRLSESGRTNKRRQS